MYGGSVERLATLSFSVAVVKFVVPSGFFCMTETVFVISAMFPPLCNNLQLVV
jgi:hypothetical protein